MVDSQMKWKVGGRGGEDGNERGWREGGGGGQGAVTGTGLGSFAGIGDVKIGQKMEREKQEFRFEEAWGQR